MLRGILKSRRSQKLYCPVVDPGEGLGGGGPPLIFYQNEARSPEKIFLETGPPLSQGLDYRPHPPLFPLSEGLDPPLLSAFFTYQKMVFCQKTRKNRVYAPGDYIRSLLDGHSRK